MHVDLSDFGEDRFRRTLACTRFPQLRRNFLECSNHLLARNWIIDQMPNRYGEIVRPPAMLNELRNNLFISDNVRHAEIFYFHEKSPSEISRPRNFIEKRKRHSKISRLEGRASGSDNSDISA